MREILQAAPGKAQALKDGYVEALRNKASDAVGAPSSEQNPLTEGGIAAFKGNSPLGGAQYGQQTPGNPSPVEFNNNNSQDTPGFGLSIKDDDRNPNKFNLNQNFFG